MPTQFSWAVDAPIVGLYLLATMFAGLAGAFFAYYINYIDPSSFSLSDMVFVVTICVVGRPGAFWGCMGGTAFLVLLPEALPGILNSVTPDPGCGAQVRFGNAQRDIAFAMNNSFGFGGNNCSLVFGRGGAA